MTKRPGTENVQILPPPAPRPLSICLLGPPQVILPDGEPAIFETAHALGLLAFLALESGRPQPRDKLAALFWPESSQRNARTNLRKTLARLHRAVRAKEASPSYFRATKSAAEINPHWMKKPKDGEPAFRIDVRTFEDLLAQASTHPHRHLGTCRACRNLLAQAASLYRGEFLEGFHLAGAQPFQEWAAATRERLHWLAVTALRRLADFHLRRGETSQVKEYAARLLRFDPTDEQAHRSLLRGLAWEGSRTRALKTHAAFRRALAAEWGVEPEPATRALVEEIRANRISPPAVPGNAPYLEERTTFLTSFVGREALLESIAGRLARADTRLLTLTGPGGAGKTRLALRAAVEEAFNWPDGVWFVPLSGIPAPTEIPEAIALALPLELAPGAPPLDSLLAWLKNRAALLVLDNYEHLLPDVSALLEILRRAPRVALLVTSRARLGLQAEHIIEAPGLASQGSRQLFTERAAAIRPGFRLDENKQAVAQIYQLVEGLPLALELAAAQIAAHSPPEIAAYLRANLASLASQQPDLLPRQRSLRAAFNYSWNLLLPKEQRALARLAVFRGNFDAAATRAIAAIPARMLAALADKSLLQRVGGGQYTWHPVLHELAAEQLAGGEAGAALAGKHSAYYLRAAARQETALVGRQPRKAVSELIEHLPNVRAAWQWAVRQGAWEELGASRNALTSFYRLSGLFQEGAALFGSTAARLQAQMEMESAAVPDAWKSALSGLLLSQADCLYPLGRFTAAFTAAQRAVSYAAAGGSELLRAYGETLQGEALMGQGQYAEAGALLEQSIPILEREGAALEAARARRVLGTVHWYRGQYETAAEIWQLGLARCQAAGDREGEGKAWNNLGIAAYGRGDLAKAARNYRKSLTIAQEIGDRSQAASLLNNLGLTLRALGDLSEAQACYLQSLRIARELGDRELEGKAQNNLGIVARALGDLPLAWTYYQASLAIAREIGDRHAEGNTLNNLAWATYTLGDYAEAEALLNQVLAMRQEIDDQRGEGDTLNNLGIVTRDRGNPAGSLVFFRQALELRRQIGDQVGEGSSLHNMGRAVYASGDLPQAQALLQQALALRETLNQPRLVTESQAALAQVALAGGNLPQARDHLAPVLAHLKKNPALDGTQNPFQVFLTCYHVLKAAGDSRAGELLQTVFTLLMERAAKIADETLRQSFLENTAAHREILAESGSTLRR